MTTAKPPIKSTAGTKATKATTTKAVAIVGQAKIASEANRKRAEALLAEIARRLVSIAEDFYDIGEALRELKKKSLFAALGYSSFAEMLSARGVMSLTQANKLIRVVSSISREKALAVGSEKAGLLIGYAEATPEPDTAEWLLDKGTLPGGKPVAEASARELAAAVKTTRSAAKPKKKTPEETQARARAREAQAALRKRGAKGATVQAIQRSGAWWLHVELPVDASELLAPPEARPPAAINPGGPSSRSKGRSAPASG